MNDTSQSISGKIDPTFVEALLAIQNIAKALDLDFIIVGAFARDVVMEHLCGLPSRRLTRDIDIAVCVASWEEYGNLVDSMLTSGKFFKGEQKQRFTYKGRAADRIIDIIPFGNISDQKFRVFWPPEQETILTTLGFLEIYRNATTVRLNDAPVLDVKVPPIPGLAMMKLLAWHQGYPDRGKDAEDLIFIMRNYHKAGIEEHLYGPEADLLRGEGFDNEIAGIRLLGRDMARLAGFESAGAITAILDEETGENSRFRLVNQMKETALDIDSLMYRLEKLRQGFQELTLT